MSNRVVPRPGWVDVRLYGAAGNGIADDTAAFLAAIDAADGTAQGDPYSTTGASMVYVPPGIYSISGALTFNKNCGMVGSGMGSTILKASHANAQIDWSASYSRLAGFTFDGNNLATLGIDIHVCNGVVVDSVNSYRCAGNGWHLENMQNSAFIDVVARLNGGHGIVVDDGCGSVTFYNPKSNASGKTNMFFTQSNVDTTGYAQPTNIVVDSAMYEYQTTNTSGTSTAGGASTISDSGKSWTVNQWAGAWVTKDSGGANQEGRRVTSNTSTQLTVDRAWSVAPGAGVAYKVKWPCVSVEAGDHIVFRDSILTHGSSTGHECPILEVRRLGGARDVLSSVILDRTRFSCDTTASICASVLDDGTSSTYFHADENSYTNSFRIGLLVGGAGSHVTGIPNLYIVTAGLADLVFHTGASFNANCSIDRLRVIEDNVYVSTANKARSFRIDGESGYRFLQYASGELQWMDGSSYSPDTNLYRTAANQLKTDDTLIANDGIATKTKAGTPSDADFATTPPTGTIVVDTSANKIWVRTGAATWKSVVVA